MEQTNSYFPRTTWRTVLSLKNRKDENYREHLGYLISLYWKPVFQYIRNIGYKKDDEATDLTQEYFVEMLEKDFFQYVSPEKGRFRIFVKVTLKHFLHNMWKKNSAQKRGGGRAYYPVEAVSDSVGSNKDVAPDQAFDRDWARTTFMRSIKAMRKHLEERGKEDYYRLFEGFYLDMESPDEKGGYKELATKYGMSARDVQNHLAYTRKLLKRFLGEEVNQYIDDPANVEDELDYLVKVIRETGLDI